VTKGNSSPTQRWSGTNSGWDDPTRSLPPS